MPSRTSTPPRRSRLAAAAAIAALAAGSLAFAAPANAADQGTISDAVFQWGFNAETGSPGFAPGTCNFLSAGVAGDAGSSHVWSEAEGLYASSAGNVTIKKPDAAGELVQTSWATKCQQPSGATTTFTAPSGNIVEITGGEGTVAADGSVEIAWDGSFSVVYYSGYTYWTATNPVLTLDADGNGQVTATASGYGTSMEDMTQWVPLAPTQIVLADITAAQVGDSGFTVTPDYLGIEVTSTQSPQVRTGANWGSFPQSFVDFQVLSGQSSYWYSSGGAADVRKPTTPLTVSYAVEAAEPQPEPGEGDIVVEVPEAQTPETGSFGWTWASSSAVDLGTATQDGANFVANGILNDVVVTDTRSGGSGQHAWSLSGQVGEFTSGADSFSGGYLGWTPKVVSGSGVTAGAAVTSTQLGGVGLATPSTLASAGAAAGATVGADLSLVIPGTTPAGDYTATLTITAVS
ncbi:hypothetical protein [Microbacterium ulmi]|uniref:Htaa protein n=1 Tax=Microbacterium ulmi TaxID=179095 RepID=A0A7Y2M1R0_9MICO|nr:hypothetical protein [Microbacterium ulmi]NII69614.1 hypothetical protein [Microbacterium ulmi]NNH03498.1 hypothetical protein [Microbacterium ulmi]